MMAKVTIGLGISLILLGVIGYVMTAAESVTALIPAFFGVLFTALGLAGCSEKRRKLMMHLAVGLSVLGLIGAARGLTKLPALLTGADDIERPAAVVSQSIMAVLCLIFIVLAVRSFIAARRAVAAAA
jgi:hypothetical protein